MKYSSIVLFLFCTIALQAAEEPNTITQPVRHSFSEGGTTSQLSLDQLVEAIHKDINKTYDNSITKVFLSLVIPYQLSEDDMINICNQVVSYGENEEKIKKIFCALLKKSNFFIQSIDYLIQEAVANFQNVTCDTLALVKNPGLQQPRASLNKLSPLLKAFVMKKALNKIDCRYTIRLTGHTDGIAGVAIHVSSGRVLTRDGEGVVRLWDCSKSEEHIASVSGLRGKLICFNKSGSAFAMTFNKANNDNWLIGQWNINSKKPTHVGSLDVQASSMDSRQLSYFSDDSLAYFYEQKDPHSGNRQFFCRNFTLQENGTILPIGTIPMNISMRICPSFGNLFESPVSFDEYPYFSKVSANDSTVLRVTKKCIDLHLCSQAIKNSQLTSDALVAIDNSQPYKYLTEFEQQKVRKLIQDKVSAEHIAQERTRMDSVSSSGKKKTE